MSELKDTSQFPSLNIPRYSEWKCELFGTGPTGIVFTPSEGNEPCWFWRWMQYICFGNKWVRKAQPFEINSNGSGAVGTTSPKVKLYKDKEG